MPKRSHTLKPAAQLSLTGRGKHNEQQTGFQKADTKKA
jgi:hypothetical protein